MTASTRSPSSPARTGRARTRRRAVGIGAALAVLATVVAIAVTVARLREGTDAPAQALPLKPAGSLALPGDTSRFDYASLDPGRHLLFVAHLGAGQIVEIDVSTRQVVRVIDHVPGVHGVLVVPALNRVYATATDADQVLTLDETTGAVLAHAPTGDYPDGLAYDPDHARIWITDESGGSETVITTAGAPVGTVDVGGDAGNVTYDASGRSGQVLVDVQSRDQVAVIDPTTLHVTRRIAVPGCDHPHGLTLDPPHRLGFIACDGSATVHTLDLDSYAVGGPIPVGDNPDVLALDPDTGRLYVAAESGTLT
ncbi:MAG TPA: YncE family protein, partial [Kineosporiaceae bacterium]